MKLHIGCGKRYREGWTNTDIQAIPGARAPDTLCDMGELPFPDGSADEVLAVHILEHVHRWVATDKVLPEWFRVLKPGGRLVIECPDVIKAARNLLAGDTDQMSMWPLYGDWNHRDPYMCHLFGWCFKTLQPELARIGFRKIVERAPEWHGARVNRDFRLEAVK